jgi:hypothetical protein
MIPCWHRLTGYTLVPATDPAKQGAKGREK